MDIIEQLWRIDYSRMRHIKCRIGDGFGNEKYTVLYFNAFVRLGINTYFNIEGNGAIAIFPYCTLPVP